MESTSKKKVSYGSVEISNKALKGAKIRVTAFVDLDVVKVLKEETGEKGAKYQTLMNPQLCESVFGKQIDEDLRDEIREVAKAELAKKSA